MTSSLFRSTKKKEHSISIEAMESLAYRWHCLHKYSRANGLLLCRALNIQLLQKSLVIARIRKKTNYYIKRQKRKSDLEIQLSLYDHLPAITIETICKNVSGHDSLLKAWSCPRAGPRKRNIKYSGLSKCITMVNVF